MAFGSIPHNRSGKERARGRKVYAYGPNGNQVRMMDYTGWGRHGSPVEGKALRRTYGTGPLNIKKKSQNGTAKEVTASYGYRPDGLRMRAAHPRKCRSDILAHPLIFQNENGTKQGVNWNRRQWRLKWFYINLCLSDQLDTRWRKVPVV